MNTSTRQFTLNIQGMTCRSCVAHVERALRTVAGVDAACIDLSAKTAVVTGNDIESNELIEAVEEAGYAAAEVGKP